jgi:2-polyprenyl-6-methoxyphenol hydroxylase-like FAD-dependent oxidoreductase
MAGLLAAWVLSERFERVTVIERDQFPKGPEFRKGVPQSKHLHAFMIRGRMISDRLFPGLSEELEEAGAVPMDSADDFEWLTPAGFAPRFPSGLPLLMCSRDLLEWTVRRRVAALPRVSFLEKTEVTGLLPTQDGKGVSAVMIRFSPVYVPSPRIHS